MEWVSGNVFIRPSDRLKAGDSTEGHAHNFDHTTIVFSGSVRVQKRRPMFKQDGSPHLDDEGNQLSVEVDRRDFTAPSHFLVEANAWHEIIALEDNTVYWCVYSHRTPQGEVIQEWTGWQDAYG